MTHDLAWAAGLFEGEGCFYFNQRTNQLGAMVGSTDLDVLETFKSVVGCGMIYGRTRRAPHHKQSWYWQANRLAETKQVFALIGDLLHSRRRNRYAECLAMRDAYENRRKAA